MMTGQSSERDQFTALETMAHRRGFQFGKADNANERKQFMLLRYSAKSFFATLDEVRSKLERV
jgi:hypothetical protein